MSEIKKVKVPCSLKGESHAEKWVERAELIGIPVYREISQLGSCFTEEDSLKRICVIFSEVITDWNLEDGEGNALPKPYKHPEALMKLAEVDSDAFLWLVGVVNSNINTLFEPPKVSS